MTRCVVVGSGMIGVLVIQVLREKGCRNIIAVDVDDDKLALADARGRRAHAESQRTSTCRRRCAS